jgi:hypothetical protein
VNQLPAHILNRQRKPILAAVSAGLGSASPPYVSIKGGAFTLIDANGEQEPIDSKYLDCVIFDVHETVAIQRVFWGLDAQGRPKPFDPNSDSYEAPTCFSDNGVGASVNSQEPQSTNCNTCKWNVWGSATSRVTGKPTKACGATKKVVVLVPGWDTPFLLRVPVMSHDNLRAYSSKFAGQQFDVSDIVTRISFVHGQVGQLDFDAAPQGFIDEATAKRIEDLLSRHVTDPLVGRGDVAVQGQIATPAQTQALPQQAQAAVQQTVGQASPFQQAEPAKPARKPRTPKAEPAPAQAGDENIPPFLRRAAEQPPAQTEKNTGIVNNAPPPNDELQAALANVFGLPTS